jgi:hypothetical protein
MYSKGVLRKLKVRRFFMISDTESNGIYQIRVRGHLGAQWADWFEGLTVTLEDNGDTLLTGAVKDQATLHGLIKKVRDLGMPLISVTRIKSNQE